MALKDWRTVKREVVLGVAVRGNDIVSEVDGGVGGVDDLLDAVAGATLLQCQCFLVVFLDSSWRALPLYRYPPNPISFPP